MTRAQVAFNESNTVEAYVRDLLAGPIKAPPAHTVQEPVAPYGPSPKGIGWRYAAPAEVPRQPHEVLVEPWLRDALIRLNPEIAAQPDRADEVLYKLRAIVLSVRSDGLIRASRQSSPRWRGSGHRSAPTGQWRAACRAPRRPGLAGRRSRGSGGSGHLSTRARRAPPAAGAARRPGRRSASRCLGGWGRRGRRVPGRCGPAGL